MTVSPGGGSRPAAPCGWLASPENAAFGGEGFELLPEFFLFRPQAIRVQGTPEPVGVALRGWKSAGSDGRQRCLDVEQALPDFRFPLRDHA